MSKSQMWIVAVAVGVVALIAGVKHFSGSADDDETAAQQRLAERNTSTDHGGWSVRSNSQDLPTGDDVRVQREADAKPGGIASPRRDKPAERQGSEPAAGSGSGDKPGQADSGNAEEHEADGHTQSATPAVKPGQPGNGAAQGTQSAANPVVGAGAASGMAAANLAGGAGQGAGESNGVPTPAPDTPKPVTPDAQAQGTPPDVIAMGALYDSKDTTFSIDNPAEVKDIGDIPGHGVTMMMHLTPDWTPDNQDDASLLKLGDNLELNKNVTFLRLEYTDPDGQEHSIGTNITHWEGIDPPYSIGVTVNDNQLAMVVNGQLVAHGTMDGVTYEPPSNPTLQIGCFDYPASRPCAAGDASGVVVSAPASTADLILHTKPADATH